jgi:hypothetical protein
MIIKESIDVARMLIERSDDIQKLGPNMRMFIVNQFCELYYELREAEGCRIKYGFSWTADECKEQLKHEFKEHIGYAENLADFIDGELERARRLKEAIAKKEQTYWDEQNAIINGEDEV